MSIDAREDRAGEALTRAHGADSDALLGSAAKASRIARHAAALSHAREDLVVATEASARRWTLYAGLVGAVASLLLVLLPTTVPGAVVIGAGIAGLIAAVAIRRGAAEMNGLVDGLAVRRRALLALPEDEAHA